MVGSLREWTIRSGHRGWEVVVVVVDFGSVEEQKRGRTNERARSATADLFRLVTFCLDTTPLDRENTNAQP